MITEESVREVIETARIEDVVADFVSLKRRGQNMIGLCPFHNEKTPSFNVNPSRNIYKCFGCGEGGDPVKFLMTLEQLSFPDAIRWLARKYNLKLKEKEVSPEMQQAKLEKDSLFILNDYAKQWFQRQLFESEEGKSIGLTYFKSRGFREETIKKFGLGYASSGNASTRGSLTKDAIQAGYKPDQLQKLGLSKNGRDFFYDRVMFTIHNLAGKPIAFAGRILKKDVKAPKYVNSPETEVYQKSKVLYGMFQARQAIRKLDQVYIVEGYTDVISLHQHGISNVVASSGTSLTSGQASLIKRFTNNATLLYDGDKAGIKAALRGVDVLLEQDLDVRVVILPEGEDPDSYMQSAGLEGFSDYLKTQTKDFLLFKAELLLGEESNDMAGKTRVVREMSDSLAKIDAPLKRSEYIKRFAGMLGVRENLLIDQVNQAISNRRKELAKDRQREQWKQQREEGRGDKTSQSAGARQAGAGGRLTQQRSGKIPANDNDAFPGEEPAWLSQDPSGELPPDFGASQVTDAPPPPVEELHLGHGWQERYLARLIIVDGHKLYDEEKKESVGHFILANIQDLLNDFDDERYKAVVDHLSAIHTAGQPSPKLSYWLNHEEVALKQMAVDFSVEPHQYSDRWQEKFGIYLSQKHPEENQVLNTTTFLRIFRKLKIDRKCRENAQKIQELAAAGDEAEMMIYLRLQQRLIELRNELAEKLGTVVPPGG
ncbi:MAG: DNA primase [Bacteroidota bacterium]